MESLLAFQQHIDTQFYVGIDTYDSERNAICVMKRFNNGDVEIVYMEVFHEKNLIEFLKDVNIKFGNCTILSKNRKLKRISDIINDKQYEHGTE